MFFVSIHTWFLLRDSLFSVVIVNTSVCPLPPTPQNNLFHRLYRVCVCDLQPQCQCTWPCWVTCGKPPKQNCATPSPNSFLLAFMAPINTWTHTQTSTIICTSTTMSWLKQAQLRYIYKVLIWNTLTGCYLAYFRCMIGCYWGEMSKGCNHHPYQHAFFLKELAHLFEQNNLVKLNIVACE